MCVICYVLVLCVYCFVVFVVVCCLWSLYACCLLVLFVDCCLLIVVRYLTRVVLVLLRIVDFCLFVSLLLFGARVCVFVVCRCCVLTVMCSRVCLSLCVVGCLLLFVSDCPCFPSVDCSRLFIIIYIYGGDGVLFFVVVCVPVGGSCLLRLGVCIYRLFCVCWCLVVGCCMVCVVVALRVVRCCWCCLMFVFPPLFFHVFVAVCSLCCRFSLVVEYCWMWSVV